LFLDKIIDGLLNVLLNGNGGGFSFGFCSGGFFGVDGGDSFDFGCVGCSSNSIGILLLNSINLSLDSLSLNQFFRGFLLIAFISF